MYAHWMVSGKSPEEKGGGGQAHVTRHTPPFLPPPTNPPAPRSPPSPPSPTGPYSPLVPFFSLATVLKMRLPWPCSWAVPFCSLPPLPPLLQESSAPGSQLPMGLAFS